MEISKPQDEYRLAEREMYFLIAKFLSNPNFEETAQALKRDLERNNLLPPRIDWTGEEHQQTFEEFESKLSHIGRNHLLQIGINLSQRLNADALLAPVVPNYDSFLGSGRQSLLRTVGKTAGPRSLTEYCTRLHGAPLADSLLRNNNHNIANVLYARQGAGPLIRRQAVPPNFYKNIEIQRITLGHLSAVYCVLFDRSGKYIVTGADDLLVKLWSAIDGRLLTTFRGASAEITDIAINLENTMLAAGSLDRVLRVWDLQTASVVAVLSEHSGMITSVNFCPNPKSDMKYLVTTSTDGTVAFWSYSQPRGQKAVFQPKPTQYHEKLRPGQAQMICASFSPGGFFLAAGSADHHVRVYQMCEDGPKRILEIESHSGTVDSIQWAHSGLRFISGSKDGTALLWRFETQQWKSEKLHMTDRLSTCPQNEAPIDPKKGMKVTMVSWDRSDDWVVTAVNDHSIKVWNTKTAKLHKVLRGHSDELYVLESHPKEAHVLLSAGHDGQICLWDIFNGVKLTSFVNHIEGQGHGGIFDAKWSPDGTVIAATDSHGHILLYGFGEGHPRFKKMPKELFFHTDYRPLIRDTNYYVLDEQTQLVPHLMPPPFLVDVDGNPYPPSVQKLVPGRENCPSEQLIPDNINDGFEPEAARSRIDQLIEALANRQNNQNPADVSNENNENRPSLNQSASRPNVTIRENSPMKYTRKTLVKPLRHAKLHMMKQEVYYAGIQEMDGYRREMKKRPLMITTGNPSTSAMIGPPRRVQRGGRRRRGEGDNSQVPSSQNTTDLNNRTTTQRLPPQSQANSTHRTTRRYRNDDEEEIENSPSSDDSESVDEEDLELSGSSSSDSESSDYSDWIDTEDKQRLAPPKRSKRKPVERRTYSPPSPETNGIAKKKVPKGNKNVKMIPNGEIPDEYKPPEWLSEVVPKKQPYFPQMGDEVVYFRQGHERYFDAVQTRDIYELSGKYEPWRNLNLKDHEFCKVIGIKYEIRPPRLCCLKLALLTDEGRMTNKHFTIKYHDIPDVIDFIVLKQTFDNAIRRNWGQGDRFRCMIDDKWWIGQIESHQALSENFPDSLFLCFKIKWDNLETESMSPWDMEPLDDSRVPERVGDSVPVLPEEIQELLYHPTSDEWPRNDREGECRRILAGINQVMGLSIAEPFLTPVDLDVYPSYAFVVDYPIDITTIRARVENHFYRRITSAQFDVRYLATNAEKFNERHSKIVKNARIVSDLMLKVLREPEEIDVEATARALAESYVSSDEDDDVQPGPSTSRAGPSTSKESSRKSKRFAISNGNWQSQCLELLENIWNHNDGEPFREPVDICDHPDYLQVIDTPMDLQTVKEELLSGNYETPQEFAKDMRLIFQNSRHFNTNKQSRIYAMTLRLSEIFEDNMKALLSRKKKNNRGGRDSPSNKKQTRPKRNNGAGPSSSHNRHSEDDDDDDSDSDNHHKKNGNVNGRSSKRPHTTQSNGVSSSTRESRKRGRPNRLRSSGDEEETSSSESSSESSQSDESSGIPIAELGKISKYTKLTRNKQKKRAAVSSSSTRKSARQVKREKDNSDEEQHDEESAASQSSAESEPKTSRRTSSRRQRLNSSSDEDRNGEGSRKSSRRVTRKPKRYESDQSYHLDGPSRPAPADTDSDKPRATRESAKKKIMEWAATSADEDDDDDDFQQKPQTSSQAASRKKMEKRRKPLQSESEQSEHDKKKAPAPTRRSARQQQSQSQDDEESDESDHHNHRPSTSSAVVRTSTRQIAGNSQAPTQQQQQNARTTRSSQMNPEQSAPVQNGTRGTRSAILSRHQRNADELDRSSMDSAQLSTTAQGSRLLRLRSANLRSAPSQTSNLSFEALNGVRRTMRRRERQNYFEDENENENDESSSHQNHALQPHHVKIKREIKEEPSSDDSDDYSEEDKTPLKLMASSSSKKSNNRSTRNGSAVNRLKRVLYSSDDNQAGPSTSNSRSATRNSKRAHLTEESEDDKNTRSSKRIKKKVQSSEDENEDDDDESEEDEEPSVSSRGRVIKNPKRLNY